MFAFASLSAPIIAAPMAGGPSTPELVAAVSRCGGLGFVAGGYLTAAELRAQILRARELSNDTYPIGVNLFVPSLSVIEAEALEDYSARLAPFAAAFGVTLDVPRVGQDREHYAEKLALLIELAPDIVSFTFGAPDAATLLMLRERDILTSVTVTTSHEAAQALAAGAGSLTVLGPAAGGHRATFDQTEPPSDTPLEGLLAQITPLASAANAPVIAAGGISSPAAVAAVLAGGAVAAQLGTTFLLADEAGTHPTHRAALAHPALAETTLTRAFTGRYGRALVTEFASAMDLFAPAGFPEIQYLTAPLRSAALVHGDPQYACLWAGTGYAQAVTAPAARIITAMMPPSLR
jgi:nitronate monooxygenase